MEWVESFVGIIKLIVIYVLFNADKQTGIAMNFVLTPIGILLYFFGSRQDDLEGKGVESSFS